MCSYLDKAHVVQAEADFPLTGAVLQQLKLQWGVMNNPSLVIQLRKCFISLINNCDPVTHMCIGELGQYIGLNNGLSPIRHQEILKINADLNNTKIR